MKVIVCCLIVWILQTAFYTECMQLSVLSPVKRPTGRSGGKTPVNLGGIGVVSQSDGAVGAAGGGVKDATGGNTNDASYASEDVMEEGRFEGAAIRAIDALPIGDEETESRVRLVSYRSAVKIENKYIVQLKNDLPETRVKSHIASINSYLKQKGTLVASSGPLMARTQPTVEQVITIGAVKFYILKATPQDMNSIVRTQKSEVNAVFEDTKMKLLDCKNYTGWLWHLDRLDMRAVRDFQEERDRRLLVEGDGRGVDVYVLDTGVREDHREFRKNRAKILHKVDAGMSDGDPHGHGTHVSGLIGGRRFGVARVARIHAIKVVDDKGEGSASWLLAGLEHAVNTIKTKPNRRSIINISLGYPKSDLINAAINETIAQFNIPIVVAAGNEGIDACDKSPSGASEAITVSATTLWDIRPKWANFGPCVDIFAPGNNIKSSVSSAWNATDSLSGTSMSSPIVVGALAGYLSSLPATDKPTVAQLKEYLTQKATVNEIRNAGKGSPNRLLYIKCSQLQKPQTCDPLA